MIAITGAAGFIGSNLAHRLAAEGHELILVDHPPSATKAANLAGLDRFRLVEVRPFLDLLKERTTRFDAIFHLGACSDTRETNWEFLQNNNIHYSQSLWNWCAAAGCPFIYASSAATYGDGSMGFDDRTPPSKLKPLNLYGRSKNDFDAWALSEAAAGRATPPGWVGLKFFNVYGPREAHKGTMASVVWHALGQIRDTGEVRLFRSTVPGLEDGHQRRDFVFVEDCIDHMLWLRAHPQVTGIYNSGTGTARTFLDLVHAVFAALGQPPKIRFIDMPASLISRYQSFTQAEMSKLREMGYSKPPTPVEEGVRRYVNALLAAR